jgi:hypothetical protein
MIGDQPREFGLYEPWVRLAGAIACGSPSTSCQSWGDGGFQAINSATFIRIGILGSALISAI